jgi:hypothetical protein
MKTKNIKHKKHERPFHLHLEYFFRHQYMLMAVVGFMAVAAVRADTRVFGVMRDAYNYGFGIVGQYLREEPLRESGSIAIGVRNPTISGK